MERSTWTDERLNDLTRHIDSRFDSVDTRFDQVDSRFDRMDARFDRADSEIRELRTELRGEIRDHGVELRAEMAALNTTLIRVGGGMMAGLVGMIAAVLVGG